MHKTELKNEIGIKYEAKNMPQDYIELEKYQICLMRNFNEVSVVHKVGRKASHDIRSNAQLSLSFSFHQWNAIYAAALRKGQYHFLRSFPAEQQGPCLNLTSHKNMNDRIHCGSVSRVRRLLQMENKGYIYILKLSMFSHYYF